MAVACVALAVLVIGGFGAYRYLTTFRTSTELPAAVVEQSNIAIYAPVKPPTGFSLQTNSISSTQEAFVYSYSYENGKTLAITVQPLPKGFNASQFKPDKEVQTSIGRAYIVDLEMRTTAAIVTEDSLIFINAPQKIGVDVLEQFINSMQHA